MGIDVIANSCFQIARAAKDATPQLLLGQESKPTFDEIEPRGTGRSEVQLKAWALDQPALNSGSFMSTIVVEDQMDVEPWRHFRIDLVEKLAKLQRTVSAMKLTDDLASLSVQGGEQRSRTVALVIMSPAFCLSWSHGQNWLASHVITPRFGCAAKHPSAAISMLRRWTPSHNKSTWGYFTCGRIVAGINRKHL